MAVSSDGCGQFVLLRSIRSKQAKNTSFLHVVGKAIGIGLRDIIEHEGEPIRPLCTHCFPALENVLKKPWHCPNQDTFFGHIDLIERQAPDETEIDLLLTKPEHILERD